jgi:hypothetical protein
MGKKILLIAWIVGMATLFVAAGLYAGNKMEDVIKMQDPAYTEREYKTVSFEHKKHIDEYKIACGECHHEDKDGKAVPLTNLKEGDNVKRCIECHKKPGYIKGKKARGLSGKEKREYHANAIHDNCKDCHKEFNKKKGLKPKDKGAAPTNCKGCHGGKLK